MRMTRLVMGLLCLVAVASAQTADELVAKNLEATLRQKQAGKGSEGG